MIEVRAYHKQLEGIIRAVSGLESKRFTDPFITANAIKYSESLKELGLNAKTPKEKAIREAQLAETRNIVPTEVSADGMTLKYSINGNNGKLTITNMR